MKIENAKHASGNATVRPSEEFDLDNESSNWWRIIAVVVVLIVLVGGFAIFRNYENNTNKKDSEQKETEDNKDDDKDDDKDDNQDDTNENDNNKDDRNNVIVVNNEQKISTRGAFIIPTLEEFYESGEQIVISVPYIIENGIKKYATVSYMFKGINDAKFTTANTFDSGLVGQYKIIYTIVYSDGTKEIKSQIITLIDTSAPTVIGVNNGDIINEDLILSAWDPNGYIATLNGNPFDFSNSIIVSYGTKEDFVLIVTDLVNGLSATFNFTIDKVMPVVAVNYLEDTLTTNPVLVTITSDKVLQVIGNGWTMAADNKSLTKTFSENEEEEVRLMDVAGNEIVVDVLVNWIDTVPTYTPEQTLPIPTVTLTRLVANKILVTVESLTEIVLPADWIIGGQAVNNHYIYTKVYTENVDEWIIYSDAIDVTLEGRFKVEIDIEFNSALVTYTQLSGTEIEATVVTDEEIDLLNIPTGWTKIDAFTYAKVYTIDTCEIVEFIGTTTIFKATVEVTIPSIVVPLVEPISILENSNTIEDKEKDREEIIEKDIFKEEELAEEAISETLEITE